MNTRSMVLLATAVVLMFTLTASSALANGHNASATAYPYGRKISFGAIKNIPQKFVILTVEPSKYYERAFDFAVGEVLYTYKQDKGLSIWQAWAISRFRGDCLKVSFTEKADSRIVSRVANFKGSTLEVTFATSPSVEMARELASFRGSKLRVAFDGNIVVPADVFDQLAKFGGQKLAIACGPGQNLASLAKFDGLALDLEGGCLNIETARQLCDFQVSKMTCTIGWEAAATIRELKRFPGSLKMRIPYISGNIAAAIADSFPNEEVAIESGDFLPETLDTLLHSRGLSSVKIYEGTCNEEALKDFERIVILEKK